MFFRFPRAHVHANFSDQSQGGRFMDAVHLGQIHSADSMGLPPHIESGLISPLPFSLAARFEAVRVHLRFQAPQVFGDLFVALLNPLLVVVKQFQTLLQRKQVFAPIVSFQRFRDGCMVCLRSFVS